MFSMAFQELPTAERQCARCMSLLRPGILPGRKCDIERENCRPMGAADRAIRASNVVQLRVQKAARLRSKADDVSMETSGSLSVHQWLI
jgi:hypothetical protein